MSPTNYLVVVREKRAYGDTILVREKSTPMDHTAPIAIVHHPHLSTANDMFDGNSPGLRGIIDYLARFGFVVSIGDFRENGFPFGQGNTAQWGNNENQSGIAMAWSTAVEYGASSAKKCVLVGESMGGLSCLSYAGKYPTGIAGGVIGLLPATDLVYFRDNGFATTINSAYSPAYNNATDGTLHNPLVMAAAGRYNAMPLQLWWADADPYATKAEVTKFRDTIKASSGAAPVTLHRVPGTGLGHSDATTGQVPLSTLLTFAQAVCV